MCARLKSAYFYLGSGKFTVSTEPIHCSGPEWRGTMRFTLTILLVCASIGPRINAQTMKSGFIQTSDGVRIHYVEAGKGRAIVFIPGWMMPGRIWQKQIDDLSKQYHVIAVDPRSQGQSDKPNYGHLPETRARDYKELVDQLGLKQPVLIGWSMGCGELLSYVEQFGDDRISAQVLRRFHQRRGAPGAAQTLFRNTASRRFQAFSFGI
jgi:pimeloyl-ACP methyl ester carboxylesterase